MWWSKNALTQWDDRWSCGGGTDDDNNGNDNDGDNGEDNDDKGGI